MKFLTNITHDIPLIPGRDYAIHATGNFGGGSLSLTLREPSHAGTLPMPGNASLTTGTTFLFTAPVTRLVMALQGATAPDLTMDCILCPL
ncbi:MAG: hypothetical protein EOP85_02045 [Verrucomicrobiaceae bacterium]|nr:MAG: hypothetical protein EOP85_02045 [Verrucomicrobiaceae bacterium]